MLSTTFPPFPVRSRLGVHVVDSHGILYFPLLNTYHTSKWMSVFHSELQTSRYICWMNEYRVELWHLQSWLTKNNILSRSDFETELVGGNQVAAAVGRGGPHEPGTSHVLLATVATSTCSEADSPSPWLGKSFLAHCFCSIWKKFLKIFALYFFH